MKSMLSWLKPGSKIGLLSLGAGIVLAFIVVPKVQAGHSSFINYQPTIQKACSSREVDASSTNPNGTGYVYRTIEVQALHDNWVRGQTMLATCNLTSKLGSDSGLPPNALPSTLEFMGMKADQIWFGPQAGTAWSASRPTPQCVPVQDAPTNPGINRCPTDGGNAHFEVFQDDAGKIVFDGSRIHCNGWLEDCGNDVYRNGTENHFHANVPPLPDCELSRNDSICPIRGAGFFNISPTLLKSNFNADVAIPIEMWGRNTWSGGYGVTFTLTMRFPRLNANGVTITQNCDARNVRVQTNSTLTPTVQLRVNGALVTTRTSKDFTYSMAGYNQRNSHTVTATATAGGTTVSSTITYEPCEESTDNSCPEIPPTENVNLPNRAPNTGGPPSYGFGTHYEHNPTGRSDVTSVQDISPGVGNVSIPYNGGTNHNVTLYYSNFENTYPYDNNQARVNYVSYYDTRVYTATGSAVYTPWYDVCTRYEYVNVGTRTRPRYEYRCTRTRRQRDFLGYRYVYQYTSRNNTASGSANGSYMDPCWDRAFELTPDTVSVTFDDYEDPDRVSFNSSISSRFTLPEGNRALRRPMQVNFSASGNYYVKRASGGTTGYPLGAISRQIDSSMTIGSTYSPTTMTRSFTDVFDAEMPPLQVGDQACFTITVATSAGRMNVPGSITRTTRGAVTSDEVCSSPLVNHPYLRVYGGDVLAGGGFGVGCSINTGARIITWGRSNGTGSAVEFAAQAASSITDFSSASGRSSAPTSPRSLSFGNTSGGYGGNFGSGSCNRDYWAAARDVRSNYSTTGETIPEGARQVRYVDGDAYLYGNVIYSNSGGWSSIDRIPSFYLIVRGNIYIDRAVTQLDGVYIAQPDPNRSNTGRIYTCTVNDRVVTSTSAFNLCGQKLTINGAFMASQVRFLRTNGSLRDSRTGEASSSSTIAEVFNYSPEMYLVDPVIFEMPTRQYESATGLPPVL